MSLVLLRIFFRSPILRRRRIRDVIPRAPDVMPPIVFWLRIGRRITCEHKLIFTDQIFSKKTAIAIAVAGGLYIVYKILALLMKSRGQPPRETPTERRAEGSPHSDTSASRRCIGRRDVSLFGETWGGHRADDEGAEGVLNHECVGEPWTPPRLPPRTTQLGILRRQCRQFQLSSLAAELTHLLEHLSSPSVPANAFVPPRIVRGNNIVTGAHRLPDLNSRHGCSYFLTRHHSFLPVLHTGLPLIIPLRLLLLCQVTVLLCLHLASGQAALSCLLPMLLCLRPALGLATPPCLLQLQKPVRLAISIKML
ncbi:hypothetical protein HF521_021917, partial [Silurus meridionalis]